MNKENIALEIREELLNKELSIDELLHVLDSKHISLSCFESYVNTERITKEIFFEYSLQELVDELNKFSNCSDVDYSFEYRVIDNKDYEVVKQSYIKIL